MTSEGTRAPSDPLIAILAAGASSRMRGRDKLLEPVDGTPLIRRSVARALATGRPCCVTLPDYAARWAALDDIDISRIVVPDAADGMAASFRAVARFAGARAVMVCLADMPDIETDDMLGIVDAWRQECDRVVRAATSDGRAGQPVVFPARLVSHFASLRGDRGGQSLIKAEDQKLVPLPGQRAVTDLDTPEDWSEWRARTGLKG